MKINKKTTAYLISAMTLALLLFPSVHGIPSSDIVYLHTKNIDSGPDSWGYRIVFDRSHGQIYSIYDAGFCGYSDLAEVMKEKGFRVEETCTPLVEKLADLTSNDIIFLGLSKNMDYNQSDIEAIHNYIHSGGNAIFVGEHNNANEKWRMSLHQNHVLADLGVQFRDDEVIEYDTDRCIIPPEENEDMESSWWFFARGAGPLSGLDNVPIYAGASIEITGNATPILSASAEARPSGAVMAALAHYGSGKAICIGDSEVMWNGGGYMSINYGNAGRFVSEVLDLLVKPQKISIESDYDLFTGSCGIIANISGSFNSIALEVGGGTADQNTIESPGTYALSVNVTQDGRIDFVSNGTVIKRIYFLKTSQVSDFSVLIDERGEARGASGADSSLLNLAKVIRNSGAKVFASSTQTADEFDSYIMVNPMKDIRPEWLSNGRRGIIAADFYTTIPYEKPWSSYIRAGWYNSSRIPVKKLFGMANATLSEKLICDAGNNSNIFYLRGEHSFGFTFPMFNAISISNPTSHTLAAGEKGSWADSYNFFWTEMTSGDEGDSQSTPVLSYSDNLMLFGGAESLTNQFSRDAGWTYLAESIADWLDIRFDISGNNVRIVTTERGSRAGLVNGGDVLWTDIENGRARIPLAKGTGGTDIVVEYRYSNGIEGSYHQRVMYNRQETVWYMFSAISIAGMGGIILALMYRRKNESKRVDEIERTPEGRIEREKQETAQNTQKG